jgi:exoribonuclease R
VIRILRRAHPFIVGTFYNDGEGARVAPDTRGLFQDVEVPGDAAGDARDGDKVAVELLEPDLRRRGAPTLRGRVAEVYGAAG